VALSIACVAGFANAISMLALWGIYQWLVGVGQLYEYRFTRFGQPGWWTRQPLGLWLPPLSKDSPALAEPLEEAEWD